MSNIGNKGEQSTTQEIAALTALTQLAVTPAGQAIVKTGATTFVNKTVVASGASIAVDKFTTTGVPNQAIILTNAPMTVLAVIVNGQALSDDAGDYSVVGTLLTLQNTSTPAGLFGRIIYAY